jgi:hypothetical protein
MDNQTYLQNVLKTLSGKPAQLGLRRVAGNKIRTHLAHAGFGIANEMAETMTVLGDWLIGERQWGDAHTSAAMDELGDVGYFMRVLAKYLKVALPSSTKRVKLKGMTPAKALFRMNTLAAELASLQKKNFYGPAMKMEDDKQVVDLEATKTLENLRNEKSKVLLEEFVPLYWAVCYDRLHMAPSQLFAMNIAKLAVRYPDGFFTLDAELGKDIHAEAKAQVTQLIAEQQSETSNSESA